MFGSIDKSKGLLFVTYDLGQSLQNSQQKMREEIETLDSNRLLNTPVTDLVTYFVEKHKIEPITLLRENWYADTKEVRVDVRYDPMRWIDDKSNPALVAGERTEVRIPFEGEADQNSEETSIQCSSLPDWGAGTTANFPLICVNFTDRSSVLLYISSIYRPNCI